MISIFARRILRATIFVTSAGIVLVPISRLSSATWPLVSAINRVAKVYNLISSLKQTSFESLIREYSRDSSLSDQTLHDCGTKMAATDLVRVDFEVYGRVQGVFFRKYTQDEGQSLGLRGFCRNTSAGTVNGTMEGPRSKVEQMKRWLQTTGSPMSRIDRVEFKNENQVDSYIFKGSFGIERTV